MKFHQRWGAPVYRVRSLVWASLALFFSANPDAHAHLASSLESSAPTSQFSTSVRFVNFSPFRRVEWGTATVPFPRGEWTPGKTYNAPGYLAELTPFGARWPDGSVRFAQLSIALDLAAGEERVIEVREGPPSGLTFVPSNWVQRGLASYDFRLSVGMPRLGQQSVSPRLHSVVQASGSRAVLWFQGRVGETDLIVDLWLTLLSGSDHMPFELRITNSSTRSEQWELDVDYVDLWVTGAFARIRGALRRGIVEPGVTTTGPNGTRLLGSEQLFDGQGQEWWGDLFFVHPPDPSSVNPRRVSTLQAVMNHPLYGVSTDWASSKAYGPFGYIPPAPPWVLDGGRTATASKRRAFESWLRSPGTPWDDWPMGLAAKPSTTGDQHDFGAAKLMQIVASGMPYGVEEARLNASEEALRPVHYREVDASPVRASQHRNWVALAGRTHFNQTVSPDRLGKPFPNAWVTANGWQGRDAQHWSSLVMAGAYLLTASPSLLYDLDNEAELYISQHTLPSEKPGWATNGIGAARGLGRTMLSMSWNFLCTGREDLKDHMAQRIDQVVGPTAIGALVEGPVKPISTYAPDPRQLLVQHWRPWEESQAVLGLEACYRVTGQPGARAAAVMAARTLMTYGWKLTATETIIATAVAWKENGVPLTPAEYQDPNLVLWSYGTGFNEWALSAVKLATLYGIVYGDYELMVRGGYVYGVLAGRRTQPRYMIGWDRFSEWDAVK